MTFLDVTNHKHAEAALRESERLSHRQFTELEHLYSSAPVGLCLMDTELRFVRINDRLAAMNGPSAAEHIGLRLRDVIPEIAPHVEPFYRQVIETGEAVIDSEVSGRTPANPELELHYLASFYPITSEAGNVVGVGAVVQDVTQRKQMEDSLRTAEAVQRSIMDSSPDYIMRINRDAIIEFINRTMPELTVEQVTGTSIYNYIPPDFREQTADCFARVFDTGKPDRYATDYHNLDETVQHFECRVSPIWQDNDVEALMISASDVTDRKQAEIALKKAHNELETRVHERTAHLNEAKQQLEEEIGERQRAEQALLHERSFLRRLLRLHERDRQLFAYDLHDGLVQHTTAAIMFLDSFIAQANNCDSETHEKFDHAMQLLRDTVGEARRLISGLRPPILDEQGVVSAIEYLTREQEEKTGLCVEFAHDVRFGRLDPLLESTLFRIAQEALNNVSKHGSVDRARLQLQQVEQRVRLCIQDEGIGFDPREVANDSYGLQGIRERARLLGGQATIDSSQGAGTSIQVELPLIEQED